MLLAFRESTLQSDLSKLIITISAANYAHLTVWKLKRRLSKATLGVCIGLLINEFLSTQMFVPASGNPFVFLDLL